MKTLEAIRAFCAVAEASSFRDAAIKLGQPVSTVSRLVVQLEDELGVKLLTRSTRRVTLTLEGVAYFEQVVSLVADLDNLNASFNVGNESVSGTLTINVPRSIGERLIAPALPNFLVQHPGLSQVQMSCTDRVIDILTEKIDCVVRTGKPSSDNVVARSLGTVEQYFAASPAFITKHGLPDTADDLAALPFIGYGPTKLNGTTSIYVTDSDGDNVPHPLTTGILAKQHFEVSCRATADDAQAYVQLGIAGLGVIEAALLDLQEHLAAGKLLIITPQLRGSPLEFNLIYHQNRHISKRVRVFHDWIKALIADEVSAKIALRHVAI